MNESTQEPLDITHREERSSKGNVGDMNVGWKHEMNVEWDPMKETRIKGSGVTRRMRTYLRSSMTYFIRVLYEEVLRNTFVTPH